MALIRVSNRCNQKCLFCNVNFQKECAGMLTAEQVLASLSSFSITPHEPIEISGGEPTLNHNLPQIITAVKRTYPKNRIILETNAVLGSEQLCQNLAQAGLETAMVSLHASNPELSDTLTQAPGTFRKTISGIHNLLKAGIEVILNVVINRLNLNDLPKLVRFVSEEFGKIPMVFSVVAPYEQAWKNQNKILFKYSEGVPYITQALKEAKALGIRVFIPDVCGIPPCFLSGHERNMDLFWKVVRNEPIDFTGKKIKASTCDSCAWNNFCEGVWDNYAQTFGTSELTPVNTTLRAVLNSRLNLLERMKYFSKIRVLPNGTQ